MTEEQIPAVQKFLARNFPANDHQNRPGWLEWQIANPSGAHIQLCLCDREIAALSFFLPVRFRCQGKSRSGAFSVSTMVAPEHRRKGLGKKIHAARLENFDFALSSGQSVANHKLYMKMGFHKLEEYRFMLVTKKIPRPYFKRKYVHEFLSWAKFKSVSLTGSLRQSGLRVKVERTLPDDIPQAFFEDRLPQSDVIFPLHNRDYLQWRYVDHPYFRYEFALVVDGDNLLGLGVLRRSGKQIILVDMYCLHKDLPRVVHSLVTDVDADVVYCRFAGARLTEALDRAGCYSHLHGSTYLGNSLNSELRADLENSAWCLFMGDSDEDR